MAEINARYVALVRDLKIKTPGIVHEALEPTFQKTQDYVPRDTELLAHSGKIEDVQRGANRFTSYITYGSGTAWYAAIVHERVDLYHAPPTRAKFISSAMEEDLAQFKEILGDLFSHALRSHK
jgi:hypothetical protein